MEPLTQPLVDASAREVPAHAVADRTVRHFRQILLWPLQLVPLQESEQIQTHAELLAEPSPDNPWREVQDEFGDPGSFQERHYSEFVAFLPQVQRFLYGQGRGQRVHASYGDSPIRVFRRSDIAAVRVAFADRKSAPARFEVAHIDLYFFYDSDVVMLALEIWADDVPLDVAQCAMFQLGRAYPASWSAAGHARNCPARVEWLGADGTVLAESDYDRREKYLSFVCRHRAPAIASHWAYLFRPLVLHHTDDKGLIRFRQIEYYRMPLLAYFAMDRLSTLTRGDFARIAFATAPGDDASLPFAAHYLDDFEARYCYDRYRETRLRDDWSETRFMCSGHAFALVGNHGDAFFTDKERGLLGQFRHQYFLLGLIAHFHKAALLMLSDRLVVAVSRLDIADARSIRMFRRDIRQTFEIFLRFTHRYWFHSVSDQAQMKDLFDMWCRHLGTDGLYEEVRDELQHMAQYLDSDVLRRHSNTMLRLTVVTILALIGTITTGFLGMNVIDEGGAPLGAKVVYFGVVFAITVGLTLFTIMRSRRLSEFFDTLSDERMTFRTRWKSFREVFARRTDP